MPRHHGINGYPFGLHEPPEESVRSRTNPESGGSCQSSEKHALVAIERAAFLGNPTPNPFCLMGHATHLWCASSEVPGHCPPYLFLPPPLFSLPASITGRQAIHVFATTSAMLALRTASQKSYGNTAPI